MNIYDISFRGPMTNGKFQAVVFFGDECHVAKDIFGEICYLDTPNEAVARAGYLLCSLLNKKNNAASLTELARLADVVA